MQQQEQLINILKNVEGFVLSNTTENEPVFYSIHYDHRNTINHKSPTTAKNFEGVEMEQALEQIKQDLQRTFQMGNKYFLIALRSKPSDPAPVYYTGQNPLYNTAAGGAIGAINNIPINQQPMQTNSPSFMDILMLMQNHQQQLELQRQENNRLQQELLKTIYEQQLQDKEKEIAAAYNSGGGTFLERLLENPAIMTMVNNLTNTTPPPAEHREQEQEQQQEQSGEAQSDQTQLTAEQIAKRQRAAQNIARIRAVFPDVELFFAELAAFVESDPKNAQFYRDMMKKQAKK